MGDSAPGGDSYGVNRFCAALKSNCFLAVLVKTRVWFLHSCLSSLLIRSSTKALTNYVYGSLKLA